VGVLPKTVRPVDVSRVLYQLHLLPDRRQHRSALFDGGAARSLPVDAAEGRKQRFRGCRGPGRADQPATARIGTPSALAELQGNLRQAMQQQLRDQLAEQRRSVVATLETLGRRISAELKDGLSKLPQPPTVEIPPPTPPCALAGRRRGTPRHRTGAGPGRALVAQRSTQTAPRLARSPTSRRAPAATAPIAKAPSGAPTQWPPGPGREAATVIEFLPYGEPPFDGARLERLRTIASSLETEGFTAGSWPRAS
jgi:hypothetical protein